MGLVTLYSEKKSALAPPPAPNTYKEAIFQMEKNGVNDLVTRAEDDTAFAAAPNLGTYTQTSYKLETARANRLVARYANTPYRTPVVANSYIANLFASGEISQL